MPTRSRHSLLDGFATDAAAFQVTALPASHRDEEQRELVELPDALPRGGVVAARAGARLPRAQVLLLGAEPEEDEHSVSIVRTITPNPATKTDHWAPAAV